MEPDTRTFLIYRLHKVKIQIPAMPSLGEHTLSTRYGKKTGGNIVGFFLLYVVLQGEVELEKDICIIQPLVGPND